MFDVLRYDEKHSLYHGGEVLPSAKTPSGKVGVHKVADPYLNSAALDVVHHPVIGVNHYTKLYLQQQSPMGLDESKYKTKEQLREEKRARLLAKQQRLREEREAAKQRGEDTKSHTRLHSKSLTSSLFIASNPIAADTAVLDQYEQRFRDHQLQNHQRHMEALPHQIMKRRRDRLRHASETPSLRAYRVFPIPNPLLLAKLRTFANDNLLRGFVLYVGRSDALIVLSGGSTAMRHMERWILEKMHWERKDTTATRVCHIPLPDAQCISFHLPSHRVRKEEQPEGELHTKKPKTTLDHEEEEFQETVFMKYVDTVAEGETFLQYLPCGEERIMHNLTSVWRSAFLVGV
ncbi:U4/U6 small nuclear ribonucleoprotein PRP3 [Angomonas deanei]|uniref:Small nuclear ribonucleoprotein Prp3 C-terminal domain-containing protein n=1 Tax=Angomonas deanei TaxID=59799 RepID=A0A7G2CSN2_9TRYP|nr:U4/U6 small nuclear ribonucleoprotein PRP3 [Angomonas deanei]CAD2221222.1 Protein of unknown function (DUF1115), putative [Angomonas deanei]|eukprot:EPY36051.1 U4/U6 small nuclear ribonucleoprotein PRP3 [Angomonas deanei]